MVCHDKTQVFLFFPGGVYADVRVAHLNQALPILARCETAVLRFPGMENFSMSGNSSQLVPVGSEVECVVGIS